MSSNDEPLAGKRRGASAHRHTVIKVVLATLLSISLATAVSVVLLYRHFNSNLDAEDLSKAIGHVKVKTKSGHTYKGPSGAINILVMGSDNRDAPGDHIDNLTGIGKRSDTTILLHLSADRKRAYGISIPRDTIVDRPACLDNDGKVISPPASGQMWNDAFNVGGPACTIRQFESITGITNVQHWVVVDFAGFKGMVDAIGGVTICLPHAVDDSIGHIQLPAGTHTFSGDQALDYVRERYGLGNGSDIGRTHRQQAFIASMIHQAFSANTLASPGRIYKFVDAATGSIHLDEGIGSLTKLAELGLQFRHIGLGHIQFLTTPWEPDPTDANRVVLLPAARTLWRLLAQDKPLPKSLLNESISSDAIPGVTHHQKKNQAQQNLANGLCA